MSMSEDVISMVRDPFLNTEDACGYLGVPKYQIVIAAATLHHRLVQEGALPPQPSQ